jgi:hypothetical protein
MEFRDRIGRHIEELTKQQEKIQDRQVTYEKGIDEAMGRELTPVEFANLRQLFADWERCEEGIEKLSERIIEWERSA